MNNSPEAPSRPYQDEVSGLVGEIWSSMLGLDVHPEDRAASLRTEEDAIISRVSITGSWRGDVAIRWEPALARDLAANMFGLPSDAITSDLIEDAIGELTNMTGGCFKSMFPEPCCLHSHRPNTARRPPSGKAPTLNSCHTGSTASAVCS